MSDQTDPPSLAPPPFWRTRYFENQVIHRADRAWIDNDEIAQALASPIRTDMQADGRFRHWAYIPRLGAYIRIVTLADASTMCSRTGISGHEPQLRIRSGDG
jgi:hypothetical protein